MDRVVDEIRKPPVKVVSLEQEHDEAVSDVDRVLVDPSVTQVEWRASCDQFRSSGLGAVQETGGNRNSFHGSIVRSAGTQGIGLLADPVRGEIRIQPPIHLLARRPVGAC